LPELTELGVLVGRARSLVHPFDDQFKDILESMKLHRHEVEEYAEMASKESVEKVNRKISDDRRVNMSIQEGAVSQACLTKLNFVSDQCKF
jgi:hypothetical protein